MMTKTKTSSCKFLVYLLMVPVCAIMLMSFGKKQNEVQPEIAHVAQNRATQDTPDIAPVDLTKVTKVVLFGEMMDHRTNKLRNHSGIDFALSEGSEVVATADGVVIAQAYGDKPGNFVRIKHNETYSTRYYHLETALVKKGDTIRKGQVIGLVGSTGSLSTAPHLHYEILKNGGTVDPKDYLPRLPGLD
jgi:murein DD-endopeptidase MepM/ murein hydrolase activator NlpD